MFKIENLITDGGIIVHGTFDHSEPTFKEGDRITYDKYNGIRYEIITMTRATDAEIFALHLVPRTHGRDQELFLKEGFYLFKVDI